MTRKYEACFLLRPELSPEDLEKEAGVIQERITANGGEMAHREFWGKRTLTYPIAKKKEANFYVFYFTAATSAAPEIEKSVRGRENVMRHLMIVRKAFPAPKPQEAADGGPVAQ